MSRSSLRQYGAVEPVRVAVKPPPPHHGTVAGQQPRRRWRALAAVTLGVAVMGLAYSRRLVTPSQPSSAGAASLNGIAAPIAPAREATSRAQPFPKMISPTPPEEISPLSFEATNFYHVRDGKPAEHYSWLKDVKLVEPHRDTTFSVSSPRDGYDYVWEVRGGDADQADDLRATARGAEVVLVLTTLDDNTVSLKEVEPGGKAVRQLDEVVMVKYVRREIRTLTDDEREELLDAVRTGVVFFCGCRSYLAAEREICRVCREFLFAAYCCRSIAKHLPVMLHLAFT